ncbi:hypothetical protein BS50DRAFT_251400 [Corynespora cassiicola Philippines]|uniref:Secreted protein n=1 Tax=Corynespora cassiicola Philippines TaxID=1448308 RepID=A0A2T2P522_CORCC|nr:hypothetical protein BS50DRAFT_251400 [Corynespora cassiicola Philippines]
MIFMWCFFGSLRSSVGFTHANQGADVDVAVGKRSFTQQLTLLGSTTQPRPSTIPTQIHLTEYLLTRPHPTPPAPTPTASVPQIEHAPRSNSVSMCPVSALHA